MVWSVLQMPVFFIIFVILSVSHTVSVSVLFLYVFSFFCTWEGVTCSPRGPTSMLGSYNGDGVYVWCNYRYIQFIDQWYQNWKLRECSFWMWHYSDVILSAMASEITGVSILCSTGCSGAYQSKHWPLKGIHKSPVDSPHKGPVTRKMCAFDDVIMETAIHVLV